MLGCRNDLSATMAYVILLVLCLSAKLLTIFGERKLSKYFSNGSLKNGWKSDRSNERLLIELDCWSYCEKYTFFLELLLGSKK